MKQMSNSSHLKHLVSSPKIWAAHPGAVPCWGCPCELRAVGQEGFLGSRPRSKANRRVPGEAETKGVEIPNLLTLWTLRGCSQPQQLKRMGRSEEKKNNNNKSQCIPCLMLLSQGQRGLGTTGTEQRVAADISVLRWRVPPAE